MAIQLTYTPGPVVMPQRCPVSGATEGLVEYPVVSWIFAIIFTRRINQQLWFTEKAYAEQLQAIGLVRRCMYGLFTVFLYIPLVGGILAAMATVYIGWLLLVMRAIAGPPGLVTYKNASGLFSGSENKLVVQDRHWAEEFCALNPERRPVMAAA